MRYPFGERPCARTHLAGGPDDDESLIGRSNLANAHARAGHTREAITLYEQAQQPNPVVSANTSSNRAS
jgi:hypothetical protein